MKSCCASCAPALQNGDTSHLENGDLAAVENNIERLGLVTIEAYASAALFDCAVCEYPCIGEQYRIVSVTGDAL